MRKLIPAVAAFLTLVVAAVAANAPILNSVRRSHLMHRPEMDAFVSHVVQIDCGLAKQSAQRALRCGI
jgi:hypothetical protein